MPRIKRLIQWEGDPNLLPNREKKTNIVYKDKSASYSSLIEVCENADNPSLPYVFTLGPAYTRRAICINRLSHIDVVNTELRSSIFIETSTYSKYTSNDTAIPITNSDGMYNGVVMPGIYLVTSSAGNIPVAVTPIIDSNDIKRLAQDTTSAIDTEVRTSGIKLQKFTPTLLFSELTNSRILWNTNNTRAFVSYGGCYIPILLFGNGKDLKSGRFNPENIRKALTSKDEVLVLFSSVNYNDNELTKLNDGTTYKLDKTWEDLGLQDLYEEYLKSK